MKIKISALIIASVFTCMAVAGAQTSPLTPSSPKTKSQIILNVFRTPSIGLEYRRNNFSWHVGLYPTIVSDKNSAGNYPTTWFSRVGTTWWPTDYLYLDASYVFGLNRDYRHDHGIMLNPGLQYTFMNTLMLRLGGTVLASPDHPLKFNPTPGLGIGFDI